MRAFVVSEAARIGVSQAARNIGVSLRTVYRWRRRGTELGDRSSRPHRSPRRTSAEREAALLARAPCVALGSGPDRATLRALPPHRVPDPPAIRDAPAARAVPTRADPPRPVRRHRAG